MAFDKLLLADRSLPSAIAWAVVFSFIVASLGTAIYNIYFHPLANFPGRFSRAAFFFPDLWQSFNGSSVREIKKLHEQYGEVVRISPDALSFTSAQAWKDIYGTRQNKEQLAKDEKRFPNHSGSNIMGNLSGYDLVNHFTADPFMAACSDADHSRIRKLISHAFSEAALQEQEPVLSIYASLLTDRLKDMIDGPTKGNVDLMAWYTFTTFDLIGDMASGESFGALKNGEYHYWIQNIFLGMKFYRVLFLAEAYPILKIPLYILSKLPSFKKQQGMHWTFTAARTEKRMDTETDRRDFLTYILRYNDERGMSRKEITETAAILIVAGSETTSTCLSGATYYLLKNPAAMKRVQHEVRSTFSTDQDINLTSVLKLPYLWAVIKETLRIYPSAPGTFARRTGSRGEIIDGRLVPAHTSVGVHQYSAYHTSANFADPEKFVPERWLDPPPEEYRHDDRAAFRPFSIGPRNCVGKHLASFELRSILARILWNFDMELCGESQDWGLHQNFYIIWEKPPLKVRLSKRKFVSL